jgi:hypothetical protein
MASKMEMVGLSPLTKRNSALWSVLASGSSWSFQLTLRYAEHLACPGIPRRRRHGIDPEIIHQQQDGREQYRQRLEKLIASDNVPVRRDVWAAETARQNGHELDQSRSARLAQGLALAYGLDCDLCKLVRNGYNANNPRHDGDWGYVMQLFYLCDPNIRLLTDDGRLSTLGAGGQVLKFQSFDRRGQVRFPPD